MIWTPNLTGPGITTDPKAITEKRNPYDLSTWGPECARGCAYKNTGPTIDGAANQRRSISSGRKHRGSAFSDLEKTEAIQFKKGVI